MNPQNETVGQVETLSILIGALGGEGGGVLTDWLVAAAMAEDFPVQSTSIPGVAQRTGATTYYLEIYPRTQAELNGQRPVMALYPSPGRVDIAVASEIIEAGRSMENGYVSPERTTLIASTHRVYAIGEKSAMGDGRFDTGQIFTAAQTMAKRAILTDMASIARENDSVLNAVMLGAIVGCGALPMRPELFEQSIRDKGVAVESNLRGYAAGLALVRDGLPQTQAPQAPEELPPALPVNELPVDIAKLIGDRFPAALHATITQGAARLVDYQDRAYGLMYLDKLAPVLQADNDRGGRHRGYELTSEAARYLALWMSYEDAIRVADIKTRPSRMAYVAADVGAKKGEPVKITEFLDPGIEEVCAILPAFIARPILRFAQRHEALWRYRRPMQVRTDTVSGFLKLWVMARMRKMRRMSYRYADEHALIGRWLRAVEKAGSRDYDFAAEIVQCARLIKGYGDTYNRGRGNFEQIFSAIVEPALDGGAIASNVDFLRRAREAALADPEGEALKKVMA